MVRVRRYGLSLSLSLILILIGAAAGFIGVPGPLFSFNLSSAAFLGWLILQVR
jgi:hypothetical protein